ncbi:hypothetical protein VVD49_12770 [Uliginosibacterium sp. H3]|uniref:Response regulator n=1 Tax=Uliginosibacterium silvisoli TaxID=3114758 RepID=A0ABU6K569_9RHOO|nr:hypothetical protein [Uliginosibacterium sp. H3]
MLGFFGKKKAVEPSCTNVDLDKTLSDVELKKRSKILVIDDLDFAFTDLFRKEGFTIDQWSDVENIDNVLDGRFDIILLDLNGVGKAYSETEQGFYILKEIKEKNPSQLVIAYTNSSWNAGFFKFKDIADLLLDKQLSEFKDFRNSVLDLLRNKYRISSLLNEYRALVEKSGASVAGLDEAVSSGSESLISYLKDKSMSGLSVAANIATVVAAVLGG